jgi:uncharacterized Tic20 family protein
MSATFQFKCPGCEAPIVTPRYMSGAKTQCSQCGLSVSIPDPNGESIRTNARRRRDMCAAVSVKPLPLLSSGDDALDLAICREDYRNGCSEHDREARKWAMLIHLALLFNFIFPCLGFITQLYIWQSKQNEFPELDEHGKNAINWFLSSLLFCALTFGILTPGSVILFAMGAIFAIIAALNANDDVLWDYPFAIRFLS